jgi:hypothetical protein
MSQRVASAPTVSMNALQSTTAQALGATQYFGLTANQAANRLEMTELYMGGQATTSTVCNMLFTRHSVVAGTPTNLAAPNADGPMDGLTQPVANAAKGFWTASTQPTRGAGAQSEARLALTYNAFGGIVRWMQNKGYGWFITGITASVSESSLSAANENSGATGAMSVHLIYEQV